MSQEFTAPRLVAVYAALNTYASGTQPDFYLQVARECDARSVLEVGCGTGLVLEEQGNDVSHEGCRPSRSSAPVAVTTRALAAGSNR